MPRTEAKDFVACSIFVVDVLDFRSMRPSPLGERVQFLFANHTLDTDRRELRRGDTPIAIEPQVFDVLTYLLENRERVVSKDDLFASVWRGRIVSDSTLASRINAARNAPAAAIGVAVFRPARDRRACLRQLER